jgi:hypothetical protein
MSTIPPRNAFADAWSGMALRADETDFVSAGAQAGTVLMAEGAFVVRYGLRILGKHWLSIVPGLVAVDYGTFLTGEEAWDFLLRKSNLYPRAEVFGFRDSGADDQMWVRQLDIALPPQVLLYADAEVTKPLARPAGWIGAREDALPERMRTYLPIFPTLDAWREAMPPEAR